MRLKEPKKKESKAEMVRRDFYILIEQDKYLNDVPNKGRAEIIREALAEYMKRHPIKPQPRSEGKVTEAA